MSRDRKLAIWIVVFVLFGATIYLLQGILLPFVAGAGVAYFLDPLADRLEKWGLSRLLATVVITVVFFALLIVVIVLLVPVLQDQVAGFLQRLPDYVRSLRESIEPLLDRVLEKVSRREKEELEDAARNYAGNAIAWLGNLLGNIVSGGVAVFHVLSLIFITPIVAFYLLRDWDRLVERVDALLPRDAAPTVRAQAVEIDRTIAGFVRGQASVCLLLGIFYAIGLSLVGLDLGILVGLGTGIISFIPYFGMLIGAGIGMALAVAQFGDWVPIAMVAGVFIVGQVIEGNFLTPWLVGDKVGLHPVWVIFALLAGGSLFGFTGVLLAVPSAAVIGVLVRFAVGRYRGSALYGSSGGSGGSGGGAAAEGR